MGVRRNPLSFVIHARLVKVDEVVFFEKTDPPDINEIDTDVSYLVKMGNRDDLLAYRKLESSQLGWVIKHRNDMRLWPDDFVPGENIAIPTRLSLNERGVI